MTNVLAMAGAITGFSSAVAVLWVIFVWGRRIVDGAKCQLRSDMLRIYYKHHETETIRQYEYENFVFAFEAYKALGGNSFIEKIYKEVQTWEVIS